MKYNDLLASSYLSLFLHYGNHKSELTDCQIGKISFYQLRNGTNSYDFIGATSNIVQQHGEFQILLLL